VSEKTIPAPLSGQEVKEALIDRISQALDKDCFLHPNAAYDFFTGKITLEVTLHDAGREDEIKMEQSVTAGETQPDAKKATVAIDLEKQPPNQVRVESGQPVPTDTGKKIKYARDKAAK